MKKITLLGFWLVLILFGAWSVYSNSNMALVLPNRNLVITFIQRLLGVSVFTTLFAYLSFEHSSGWRSKPLLTLSYLMIFVLMLIYLINYYYAGHGIDPFYVFTQVCVLCGAPIEYYLTLGRVAFWLMATIIVTNIFKDSTPFLKKNWKRFEDLNYLIFLLLGIQGYLLILDFRIMPFFAYVILAVLIILYIIFFKKLPEYYRSFRSWLSD